MTTYGYDIYENGEWVAGGEGSDLAEVIAAGNTAKMLYEQTDYPCTVEFFKREVMSDRQIRDELVVDKAN